MVAFQLLLLIIFQLHGIYGINLAFGVMVYQKKERTAVQTLADFHQLMSSIYTPNKHVYSIHVDKKSDAFLLNAINNDFCGANKNCASITPRNVGWAGLTTGEMMLALMQTAYEFPNYSWDYFILIGHESVPLASLSYVESFLSSYPSGTNFQNCWRCDGYDFFGQWENNIYRLEEVVVDTFEGQLVDAHHYHHEGHRQARMRRNPPDDIVFYKSIQLMVMSPEYVKYAIYGIEARRILMYLMNVRTSDEMFLPTILQSDETLAKTATCNTTLHFTHWIRPGGSWHPEYLTLQHLPILLNTTSHNLFARKFEAKQSKELLDVWARVRDEHLQVFHSSDRYVSLYNRILKADEKEYDASSGSRQGNMNQKEVQLIPADQKGMFDWMVPIIADYVYHKIIYNSDTDTRVMNAMKMDGYLELYREQYLSYRLQYMSSGPSTSDVTEMAPFRLSITDALQSLDCARRAGDAIVTHEFWEYIKQMRAHEAEVHRQEQLEQQQRAKFTGNV